MARKSLINLDSEPIKTEQPASPVADAPSIPAFAAKSSPLIHNASVGGWIENQDDEYEESEFQAPEMHRKGLLRLAMLLGLPSAALIAAGVIHFIPQTTSEEAQISITDVPNAPDDPQATESTPKEKLSLVPKKDSWVLQDEAHPIGAELNDTFLEEMDRMQGRFAYTVDCVNGEFQGENFMHWRSEEDKPTVTDWNVDVIEMGKYGRVSHPEIVCAEYEDDFTGQVTVIWE